jgi:F-type H+-transporting ATPase subunit gamma
VPSLLDIKARLKATESIKKITRAMQLVAAAKFKRSEVRAKTVRPYCEEFDRVLRVLAGLVDDTDRSSAAGSTIELSFEEGDPPVEIEMARIFERREEPAPKRVALALVTSDRGLCGAFNTKLIRAAHEFILARPETDVRLVPIGRKGNVYFKSRNFPILFSVEKLSDKLELEEIRRITRKLVALFVSGDVDAVYFIYPQFKTVMTSSIRVEKFLSIPRVEKSAGAESYILEPDSGSVYRRLLPLYATTKVFATLADAFASEYGARMTAMQLATNNAEEMMGLLTLQRNRLRQAVITKELAEIVGGAQALE